jgi:protein-S-isoprenylcysteine O-methyltransferase Ste14
MQKALSILALLVMLVSLVGLVFAHALFSWSPITIGLQVCAGLLMLWARLTFGIRSFHGAATPTEGGLVTTGPYRHIRHPIYTSIVLFVWAGAVANRSFAVVAMAAMATVGALVRMLCEEQLLVQRYPEYASYAKMTNRMIPYLF